MPLYLHPTLKPRVLSPSSNFSPPPAVADDEAEQGLWLHDSQVRVRIEAVAEAEASCPSPATPRAKNVELPPILYWDTTRQTAKPSPRPISPRSPQPARRPPPAELGRSVQMERLIASWPEDSLPHDLAPLSLPPHSPLLVDCGERTRFGCQLLFCERALHHFFSSHKQQFGGIMHARDQLATLRANFTTSQQVWDLVRREELALDHWDGHGRLPAPASALLRLCEVPEAASFLPCQASQVERLVWDLQYRLLPRKAAQFLFEAAMVSGHNLLASRALSLFLAHLDATKDGQPLDEDANCALQMMQDQWSRGPATTLRYVPLPKPVKIEFVARGGAVTPSSLAFRPNVFWRNLLVRSDLDCMSPTLACRYLQRLAQGGRVLSPSLVEGYAALLATERGHNAAPFLSQLTRIALEATPGAAVPLHERLVYPGSTTRSLALLRARAVNEGRLGAEVLAADGESLAVSAHRWAELALLAETPAPLIVCLASAAEHHFRHALFEELMCLGLARFSLGEEACRQLLAVYQRRGRPPDKGAWAHVLTKALATPKSDPLDSQLFDDADELSEGQASRASASPRRRALYALLDTAAVGATAPWSLTFLPVVPGTLLAQWRLARRD